MVALVADYEELAGRLNGRQRQFAESAAGGMVPPKAYQEAGFSPNGARQGASRLLTNVDVAAYLNALRRDLSKSSAKTREDMRDLFSELAWNPENSTRDRIRAGEMLCKMQGWFDPQKVDVGVHTQVSEVVRSVLEAHNAKADETARRHSREDDGKDDIARQVRAVLVANSR